MPVVEVIILWSMYERHLPYNPGQKDLGQFPLLSFFYMETAGNQQFTVIQIALTL